jgi:hypothetical protein
MTKSSCSSPYARLYRFTGIVITVQPGFRWSREVKASEDVKLMSHGIKIAEYAFVFEFVHVRARRRLLAAGHCKFIRRRVPSLPVPS